MSEGIKIYNIESVLEKIKEITIEIEEYVMSVCDYDVELVEMCREKLLDKAESIELEIKELEKEKGYLEQLSQTSYESSEIKRQIAECNKNMEVCNTELRRIKGLMVELENKNRDIKKILNLTIEDYRNQKVLQDKIVIMFSKVRQG